MLMELQVLAGLRGVKRIMYLVSSRLFRTPSIQPKHSATCTDSGQMMLGFPELFLWKPTNSSWNLSWCDSNQARKSDGVGKNMGFAVIASCQIKSEIRRSEDQGGRTPPRSKIIEARG